MNQYLITFTYDYYCQGYDKAQGSVLVNANTFEQACEAIKIKFYNARDFENLTLWVDGSLVL